MKLNGWVLLMAGVMLAACVESDESISLMERKAALLRSDEVRQVIQTRASNYRLREALMGGLLYLDDTQIRERDGLHNPMYDACSGDGCFPMLVGTGQALPLPLPFTKNLKGEWANFVNIFPDMLSLLNQDNESVIQLQDSNAFVPAAISFPLYLFDEGALPQEQQVITAMRTGAFESIQTYRRDSGFAFWPQLEGSTSDEPRVGPMNIPMKIANLRTLIPGASPPENEKGNWVRDVFDREKNPSGADAMGNVSNDADDSAVAFASMRLNHEMDQGPSPDLGVLADILQWLDEGRVKEDGRDAWKGPNSGAFLTWLKDENLPDDQRFMSPETGVMTFGINNVDCVVNANVLLAMGLADSRNHPSVLEASATLRLAVERHAWPECGLYYPQKMIFPYSVSRAYHDGLVQNPDMREAMKQLLVDLLSDRTQVADQDPDLRGAFSGGADPTHDLSTALALNALLNIGLDLAEEAGLRSEVEQAIEEAVWYLVDAQKIRLIRFSDTFNRDGSHLFFPGLFDASRTWDSGLYFAASSWSLAQWRSQPYTVAIILEALAKYMMAYEFGGVDILTGRRIRVEQYARNTSRATKDFLIQIN